jgi:hypothetical protein
MSQAGSKWSWTRAGITTGRPAFREPVSADQDVSARNRSTTVTRRSKESNHVSRSSFPRIPVTMPSMELCCLTEANFSSAMLLIGVGSGRDRRAKLLIYRAVEGSVLEAHSQRTTGSWSSNCSGSNAVRPVATRPYILRRMMHRACASAAGFQAREPRLVLPLRISQPARARTIQRRG